jgi:hypothetical protein
VVGFRNHNKTNGVYMAFADIIAVIKAHHLAEKYGISETEIQNLDAQEGIPSGAILLKLIPCVTENAHLFPHEIREGIEALKPQLAILAACPETLTELHDEGILDRMVTMTPEERAQEGTALRNLKRAADGIQRGMQAGSVSPSDAAELLEGAINASPTTRAIGGGVAARLANKGRRDPLKSDGISPGKAN